MGGDEMLCRSGSGGSNLWGCGNWLGICAKGQ